MCLRLLTVAVRRRMPTRGAPLARLLLKLVLTRVLLVLVLVLAVSLGVCDGILFLCVQLVFFLVIVDF